jgi:hypothetical protein
MLLLALGELRCQARNAHGRGRVPNAYLKVNSATLPHRLAIIPQVQVLQGSRFEFMRFEFSNLPLMLLPPAPHHTPFPHLPPLSAVGRVVEQAGQGPECTS